MAEVVGKKLSDGTIPVKTALTGSEQIYINDAGVSKKTTPDSINALVNTYPSSITKDPTGFSDNENIAVTYNGTTRKVTLTGTFVALWQGVIIPELVTGWESPAHADVTGTYFLKYDGSNFVFDTAAWSFDLLQICVVQYNDASNTGIALREVHGFMDHTVHESLHLHIGTVCDSGGDLSSFTLASTTAADRRPDVSAALIHDEDLHTVNPALSSKLYTQFYLSGAGVANYVVDAADILPLSTNNPYYNFWNGSAWVQSLMTNNSYAAVFLIAVPVTIDTNSQKYRYIWIQPQTENGSLSVIQAITPEDINLDSTFAEYVFIGKIIIQFTSANWKLTSIEKITGSKFNQTSTSGSYLSTVSVDGTTVTGTGTPASPLSSGAIAGSGVTYGYINDSTQTIAGVKTLSSSPIISSETALTIASFDAAKNIKSLPVATYPSLTELSYVKGVTSAIQTQFSNLKKQTSIASDTTPNPTGDGVENEYYLTALAGAAAFEAPSGTPVNGNNLLIRIKDNGTARALTYNAIYKGFSQTLPSTTIVNKEMYLGFIYNSASSKWDLVSYVPEV